ncbi:hypothetical protein H6G65_09795 [Microcystis elabens FACHB-917]|nr:hypothetical protein [Microcystis elabens FACHB-917]
MIAGADLEQEAVDFVDVPGEQNCRIALWMSGKSRRTTEKSCFRFRTGLRSSVICRQPMPPPA